MPIDSVTRQKIDNVAKSLVSQQSAKVTKLCDCLLLEEGDCLKTTLWYCAQQEFNIYEKKFCQVSSLE